MGQKPVLGRLGLVALVLGCAPSLAAGDANAKERLDVLLADAWEHRLVENPLLATAVGDHRFDERLPSVTMADLQRRAARSQQLLDRLQAIDPASLTPADRVNHRMFEIQLRDDLAGHRFGDWRIPLTSDSGFHTEIALLPREIPLVTVRDYENYIARLRAIPGYFDQHVALLREGLRTGFTAPRVVLDGYEVTIRTHAVAEPEKSVFWAPFEALPSRLPAPERERLRAADGLPCRRRPAGVPLVPRLLHPRVPAGGEDDDGGRRVAGRAGLLRVARAALHDARHDRGRSPRDRVAGGRADPRRDAGGHSTGRLRGKLPGVPGAAPETPRSTRTPEDLQAA
jgi:hypothetical protein